MRWMLAIAAVFVLAGCGSGVPGQAGGAPITPDQPAPPLIAANESPPDDIAWFLKLDFETDVPTPAEDSGTGQADLVCEQTLPDDGNGDSWTGAPCPQPSPEEVAKMQAEDEQYTQAIRPVPGSDPQVVAKLELGREQKLFFTEWTASSGAACWEIDEEGPDGGGGGGPSGPCVDAAQRLGYPGDTVRLSQYRTACTSLCLDSDSSGSDDPATADYRLGGTVPADAEALRVTVAGGGTATYPLVGPRLSDPSLRVFMVDLGSHDWRKVELIRGGAVTSTETMPPFQVAYEDCASKIGPMPTFNPTTNGDDDAQTLRELFEPYNKALDDCLRAKGVW